MSYLPPDAPAIGAIEAPALHAITAQFEARMTAAMGACGQDGATAAAARAAVRSLTRRLADAVALAQSGNLRELCVVLEMLGDDAKEVYSLNLEVVPASTQSTAARIRKAGAY